MPLKTKRKGKDFENLAVEILTQLIKKSKWRRIPGSGAIGTSLSEPILTGDISGNVESIPKKIKIEAKVGYGGSKQFALKKEWLDKIKGEAINYYAIPMLIGKFSGAKDGVKVFMVLDIETFAEIINMITDLKEQLNTKEYED
jgi:hypothetical protein